MSFSPFLAPILVFLAVPLAGGTLSRGPYLQLATPESVTVVWRTTGDSAPQLRFGNTPTELNRTVPASSITLRVSYDVPAAPGGFRLYHEPMNERAQREADHDPSTAPNTFQYEARVSDLQPGTRYYYAVFDGDRRLAGGDDDHFFVTHPARGTSADMRLWVVGDSGTGGSSQAMVHDAMRAFVRQDARPLDHYLHLGDMAYSDGTDREFQRGFFDPYQATLRNTACWPTMGNHEGHTSRGISGYGPYYDAYVVPTRAEAGGVPSGTEAYYSFAIADVHFICLDSHDLDRSPDAPMARWLRADLEKARAKWLIAFWHHPPYTMGSHNSDRERQLIEMRETFMPILEAGGVDLTLTGHSHIYERSMLMDGAYATPTTAQGVILNDGDGNPSGDGPYHKSAGLHPHEGSVSIVAGHGGAGLGREGTMPVMRQIILEHGSVLLDIRGDTLTGTMVNKHGVTRDIFSIVKRGQVTPTRVANPWQPVHDIALLTEIRLDFATDHPGAKPQGWTMSGRDGQVTVVTEPDGQRKFLRTNTGTELLIATYPGMPLRQFEFETTIRLGERASAGLVFAYIDPKNHQRLTLEPATGTIHVTRVANGTATVVAERATKLPSGEWIDLAIEVMGSKLVVEVQDGATEFSVDLGAAPAKGALGILVLPGGTADFRTMVLEDEEER